MRQFGLATAVFLLLLISCSSWTISNAQQQLQTVSSDDDMAHFVRIANGHFVVNCKTFYVSGWNQWEAVEAGAGALELFGASLPPNTTGPALLRRLLDRAVANGFTVVRAWATAVSPQYALETSPGVHSEAIFQGLDYLMDEARKRGIRVLLSLTDNWQQTGGVDELVRWAGSGLKHNDFFTDSRVKALYKGHVAAVLGRTNSINGRTYSQDPTIFALNLINEPRCYQCGNAIELWVREMAAYVKGLDRSHLLTVGEEGFYPAGIPQAAANPQRADSWATEEGQNFIADHSSPDIDFAAMHLWVNNWEDKSPQFPIKWIQQHAEDARALGKPLLLEEFGVWSGDGADRARYYQQIYDAVQQNAEAGGPLKGALFWTWYAEGQRAPAEEQGGATGLFGVFESDGQIWPIISSFAQAMRRLSGAAVPGCLADSAAAVPAPTSCPKGFEGPACNLDINECARGTANCAASAVCVNTNGGFTCSCPFGYTGDGATCTANPAALAAVQARYSTPGAGQLACSEGRDVPYPEGAPGFQYDLTDGLSRTRDSGQQGGLGSRAQVDPLACMLACEQAPGCDSFSFNPTQQRCFLKAGASAQTCQAAPTTCVSARGSTYSCGIWQTYFRAGGASSGSSPAGIVGGSRAGSTGGRTSSTGGFFSSPTTNGSTVRLLPPPQQQEPSVQLFDSP